MKEYGVAEYMLSIECPLVCIYIAKFCNKCPVSQNDLQIFMGLYLLVAEYVISLSNAV